jgi:hypothetical protein
MALLAALGACQADGGPAALDHEAGFGTPSFTMGSGSSSTLLGRATFSDGGETFKVKRITGDWHVEIKAKPALDLTAGQGFLDVGEHAHIARNETSQPAQNLVTCFAPPGAALRIDAPQPGNCPF